MRQRRLPRPHKPRRSKRPPAAVRPPRRPAPREQQHRHQVSAQGPRDCRPGTAAFHPDRASGVALEDIARALDGFTLVDTTIGGAADALIATAEQHGGAIRRIALTHGHGDHVGSLDALRERLGDSVRVLMPELDARIHAGEKAAAQPSPTWTGSSSYGTRPRTATWSRPVAFSSTTRGSSSAITILPVRASIATAGREPSTGGFTQLLNFSGGSRSTRASPHAPQAIARESSSSRSRALLQRPAARSNSSRASAGRPRR
jgi:Metallo-beta-lactamase superfamily